MQRVRAVVWYLYFTSILGMVSSSLPGDSTLLGKPFGTWRDVSKAQGSEIFRSQISDMQLNRGYANQHPWLREELLYVQSNSRILICQNPRGILRHLALPIQVYPVPNGPREGVGGIFYEPGVFYFFDLLTINDLRYQIQLEDEEELTDVIDDMSPNQSYYGRHFLPITRGKRGNLEVTLFSYAPVGMNPETAPLSPAPLPGPAGAFYILRLKNNGEHSINGSVALRCPAQLGNKRTDHSTLRGTLTLTSVDGSVGLHMSGGNWKPDQAAHLSKRDIEIEPGEELIIETRVAMSSEYHDIMPTLHELFLLPSLEWLNRTAEFWRERLGQLDVGVFEGKQQAELSRDLYIRCVMDNFSCLQTDDKGNLISHYQGAAKGGGIWGIDYEPTLISIAPFCPELARQGILFTMERNRPPRKIYRDHSVPILVSPLLIARKWLELTGDVSFFLDRKDVLPALEGVINELNDLKASGHDLYPTRYSSDGPVARKYDHGTNVKVWYAYDSYAYLLDALGRETESAEYYARAASISKAITDLMIVDGPFGPQFSGGTNLGEEVGNFYLPEDLVYYDGEDSATHLAPIYGIYGFGYKPWINYHRFARSIFCSNYEPEVGALRWYPSGLCPVVDGSGYFSRLGGSVSRTEMAHSLRILHENACDETGSVYWWPIGANFKRGLTRCSQGQGSWAWQYLEQWLGIKVDALKRTLTVAPRGLLTQIDWNDLRVGGHSFDLNWIEEPTGSRLVVRNFNQEPWTVKTGFRNWGSGADQELIWRSSEIAPGESGSFRYLNADSAPSDQEVSDVVALKEAEQLAKDGVVFMRYGPVAPLPPGFRLWDEDYLDVRFYIMNASDSDWSDAEVTLRYPQNWLGSSRRPRYSMKTGDLSIGEASFSLGPVRSLESKVAPFSVDGPHQYDLPQLSQGLSPHFPSEAGTTIRLPTKALDEEERIEFEALLKIVYADGSEIVRKLTVPVKLLPADLDPLVERR